MTATPPFGRVLVANRGEIAVRIMTTLRSMGIESAAVHSDADAAAPHVAIADMAVSLGAGPARDTYLDVDKLLAAVAQTGAEAVHPGYGFLSENEAFAIALEGAGVAFIGPTPEQLRVFGEKHLARDAARAAGVPLLEGSGLLDSVTDALDIAATVGYPVMLKAVAGGGGIGMSICRDADELNEAYSRVQRLAQASFGSAGVFLERYIARARHVEVQIFGDGVGGVVTLGERDCSMQRRNQKVVEESPAFALPDAVRTHLAAVAKSLAESVSYRSAGTVEFLVDAETFEPAFLEVNARLQVEHPVTEAVWGVDLVEWMVRVAAGQKEFLDDWRSAPREPDGHAIEVRLYAEDPGRDYRPSPGLLTEVVFPDRPGVRVDGWVSTGTEVSPLYDPLLAKIIAHGANRDEAADRLSVALAATSVAGVQTNLRQLRAIIDSPIFRDAAPTTGDLAGIDVPDPTFEVVSAGTMTTVQDHPGRVGRWHVGVPPSGPMDDLSFRLGNVALGNESGTPGLELTVSGPTLRFATAATICLAGAEMPTTLDGEPVAWWEPVAVLAGATLAIGTTPGPGLRSYLLVQGGIDVPRYLGSAATFTLGGFGGHGGRALRAGDVVRLTEPLPPATLPSNGRTPAPVPDPDRPDLVGDWQIAVLIGPHPAPEFFTPGDIETFFTTSWGVHHNSSRTGVRLVGPRPQWARSDGGEAGLHPSNIHDTPYAIGAIDFTGDMPIILGPDGPSLGGFVCPAVICEAERWKIGQLRPGDTVQFVPVDSWGADALRAGRDLLLKPVPERPERSPETLQHLVPVPLDGANGVLARREATDNIPELTVRRAGDDYLLVEYGPMLLDIEVRLRVHTLMQWVQASGLPGIIDVTPGIRSLQLHLDPSVLSVEQAAKLVLAAQDELPSTNEIEVPSRIVHLPLSWDDPATREAIERYMTSVRSDAPWCPWNIEFIRRINGLDSTDAVQRTVFDANYLVLGLGDVYLGAPVATPLDPRHRLVTTKYNPARTWTPQNAVGIGGAYLCIYGMEGPGGYQFVGRTVQIWNTFRDTARFGGDTRWLLRFFDQIKWYPVDTDELGDMRDRMDQGRLEIDMEETSFKLSDYQTFLADEADSIAAFRETQQTAFQAERAAWEASGEFDRTDAEPVVTSVGFDATTDLAEGATLVTAPLAANVWQVRVEVGDLVEVGDALVVLEAMKMETWVYAEVAGRVAAVLAEPGSLVTGGAALVVLEPVS